MQSRSPTDVPVLQLSSRHVAGPFARGLQGNANSHSPTLRWTSNVHVLPCHATSGGLVQCIPHTRSNVNWLNKPFGGSCMGHGTAQSAHSHTRRTSLAHRSRVVCGSVLSLALVHDEVHCHLMLVLLRHQSSSAHSPHHPPPRLAGCSLHCRTGAVDREGSRGGRAQDSCHGRAAC
jgi:hypothetical protein